jgi:hypothetical protein
MAPLTLRASTGPYVCAELDGTLTATRPAAGAWETFAVESVDGGRFALKTAHGLYVCAEGGGGGRLVANRTAIGAWECFRSVPSGIGIALQTATGHYWCAEGGGGGEVNATRTALGAWETFNGPPPPPVPPVTPPTDGARTGVVRASGRRFLDDQGVFCPMGGTLFWAMRGWKFERDRVKLNMAYLAHYCDYQRILAQVGWSGNEIDEDWPDHVQILGEVIDYAYDVLGMRTQVTGVGGGDYSATKILDNMIAAIRGRESKVIYTEVANEWYGNWDGSEEQMKAAGKKLLSALPNLVALSAPQEEMSTQRTNPWVRDGFASMGTAHKDRSDTKTDWKWRHVRQTWESRDPSYPLSHGEPGGPLSSVASFMEPIHLAMSRAVGILCGFEGYCLHNAAGVTGQVDPARGRPANVWEVPGIDQIMATVRALTQILPGDPSAGQATRKGLGAHPLTADLIWPDGGDHGVVRDYARRNGATFWQCLQGVKNYVNLTADRAYRLTLIDPITHAPREMSVGAGETIRVDLGSVDTQGYGAWIIRGVNA